MWNTVKRANTGVTLSIAGLASHLVTNAVDSMTGLVITDLVEHGVDSSWGRMIAEFGLAGVCTAAFTSVLNAINRWKGPKNAS